MKSLVEQHFPTFCDVRAAAGRPLPDYVQEEFDAYLKCGRQHFPTFCDVRAAAGRPLPDYVQEEFDAYLKCGRLEEGFLRVRCEQCRPDTRV